MKIHYATLPMVGYTKVKFEKTDTDIEMTFEREVESSKPDMLVMDLEGSVVDVFGFAPEEVNYFKWFLDNNKKLIRKTVEDRTA